MTGFINVNKAQGVSSAREVAVIKKLTGVPCGHMGTLDPMATGVLPVAIGNAARLFDYLSDKRKIYVADFRFGVDSDTLDTTGNITFENGLIPQAQDVAEVLPQFVGEIMQIPPKYSAKNIEGKKGYQLARAGIDFELPPKKVKIFSIELINQLVNGDFRLKIECGGGTYIRSLARDIAKKLNTVAVMSALVRTQSGVFGLENSVCTEDLNKENILNYLISTQDILPFPSIYPQGSDAKKLFNGLGVKSDNPDGTYKIFLPEGLFYGLAEIKEGILKVRTKLC